MLVLSGGDQELSITLVLGSAASWRAGSQDFWETKPDTAGIPVVQQKLFELSLS